MTEGDAADDILAGMREFKSDEAESKRAFESRVITKVLQTAGYTGPIRQLQYECQRQTGGMNLTIDWFEGRFSPPFALMVSHASNVWQIPMVALFGKSFTKLAIVQEFERLADERAAVDSELSPVMVFRAARADGASLMVLHQQTTWSDAGVFRTEAERAVGVTRITRFVGNPVRAYVIESLQSFMGVVGNAWIDESA